MEILNAQTKKKRENRKRARRGAVRQREEGGWASCIVVSIGHGSLFGRPHWLVARHRFISFNSEWSPLGARAVVWRLWTERAARTDRAMRIEDVVEHILQKRNVENRTVSEGFNERRAVAAAAALDGGVRFEP